MPTIRVSQTLKDRLDTIKETEEHTSLDSTLRSMVETYTYPIAPNGLADAFDRKSLAMLNRFNLDGVATPLPTALENYFGSRFRDMTKMFRLYIGGWWLTSPQVIDRPSALPHFEVYSTGGHGGFLFKFQTTTDVPFHGGINRCIEGTHWFLVEQDDYEDAVLRALDAEDIEFLAPVGGVPEQADDDEMIAFGGYGAKGRSQWDYDTNQPKHVPEWHDMPTVAEYIRTTLDEFQQLKQEYDEQLATERRESKQEFIDKLVAYGVTEAEDIDPDEVDGTDLIEMIPDDQREAFEADDGTLAVPGSQIRSFAFTIPVERAVEYQLYSPDDIIAGDNDDETYTAEDIIEMDRSMDLQAHIGDVPNDAEALFRMMFDETHDVNPHGLSEDDFVDVAMGNGVLVTHTRTSQ